MHSLTRAFCYVRSGPSVLVCVQLCVYRNDRPYCGPQSACPSARRRGMFLRRLAGCAPGNSIRVDNRESIPPRQQLLREIARSVIQPVQVKSVDHGLVDLLAVLPMLADGAVISSQARVKRVHRVMQGGIETGEEMFEVLRIDLEPEAFRFFDEPMQCFVRETVRRIPTSDVAMDTAKPGLLETAGPGGRPGPEAGFEGNTLFVQCERVVGILDVRVQHDVVIRESIAVDQVAQRPRCSERTHRVPDA